MPFDPQYLILHDYASTPKGDNPFNPYHALISGGRKLYRYPENPYGKAAPHAYQLNPYSIGLSWGGPSGGQPGPDDLALLREEYASIKKQFPNIKVMSHGEAFAARDQMPRASKLGRGLEEASWRTLLDETGVAPSTTQIASTPSVVPMAQRSITAGHPAAPQPAPSPPRGAPVPTNYKSVSAPSQVMGPDAVSSARAMAKALLSAGREPEKMTHWTQALGKILQSGTGALWNDQALAGERDGQSAGNAALADMLAGGDSRSAMTNPYSADTAMKYQMRERENQQEAARQVQLLQERQRLEQSSPAYQADLEMKKAQTEALRIKGQEGALDAKRVAELEKIGIDPHSAEGMTYRTNGKLPAAAYQQMAQKQRKTQMAPKIVEGLTNLSKMADTYNDAAFENALGPIQGSDPDSGGLLTAPIANISRLYGEAANVVQGGNATPNEVRNNVRGSTEALAAAIKPLIRDPGEGVWTDADQERLVGIVGDLGQSSSKAEYRRRLNAVADRVRSNFGLQIDFNAEAAAGAPQPAATPQAPAANDGWTEINGVRIREKR